MGRGEDIWLAGWSTAVSLLGRGAVTERTGNSSFTQVRQTAETVEPARPSLYTTTQVSAKTVL